jgi:hypothetical protein
MPPQMNQEITTGIPVARLKAGTQTWVAMSNSIEGIPKRISDSRNDIGFIQFLLELVAFLTACNYFAIPFIT